MEIGDFIGHVGKKVDGFEGVHGGKELESEIWKVEYFWNSAIRRIYVWQIHGWFKKEKTIVTYSSGGNETEIDFVLVEKDAESS